MAENDTPSENRWPKPSRERAAELYALGASLPELVEEFEVSERSMRRWLQSPEALAVIASVRRASSSVVTGKMVARLEKAGRRLDELMDSSDERVALAASKAVFDVSFKLRLADEFDDRMAVIERRLGIGIDGADEEEHSGTR